METVTGREGLGCVCLFVCVCELGQADNSMLSEAAADKPLLLLGVTQGL